MPAWNFGVPILLNDLTSGWRTPWVWPLIIAPAGKCSRYFKPSGLWRRVITGWSAGTFANALSGWKSSAQMSPRPTRYRGASSISNTCESLRRSFTPFCSMPSVRWWSRSLRRDLMRLPIP